MTEHLTDDQFIDYVIRTLTDDQRTEMDRHLAACATCRVQVAEHEAVQRRLHNKIIARRNAATPPSRLTYAVIATRISPPDRVARLGGELNRLASGALAIAALLALALLLIGVFGSARQATVNGQLTPTPTAAPTPVVTTTLPATLVWKIEAGTDPLVGPSGLALDAQGNLYVVDAGNNRIRKYDRDGKLLTQWGRLGQDDGQFSFGPVSNSYYTDYNGSVAVDRQGNVYVADTGNARIQKFNSIGKFLLKWGSPGEGEGQFGYIVGVVVDSQGNVYVAENQPRPRVQKFDSNGQFLLQWNTHPPDYNPALHPHDIAIDQQDFIYLLDLGSGSIQKNNQAGRFVSNWPLSCDKYYALMAPNSIAVDVSGNVYVADYLSSHMCKYDRNGQFITRWSIEGTPGVTAGIVSGIVIDAQGNVYVAEPVNNRIEKFSQP
jgi:sugar lactone lactonase YvrE